MGCETSADPQIAGTWTIKHDKVGGYYKVYECCGGVCLDYSVASNERGLERKFDNQSGGGFMSKFEEDRWVGCWSCIPHSCRDGCCGLCCCCGPDLEISGFEQVGDQRLVINGFNCKASLEAAKASSSDMTAMQKQNQYNADRNAKTKTVHKYGVAAPAQVVTKSRPY